MAFIIPHKRIGADLWANIRLNIFKNFKIKGKKILDLGCGSGYLGANFKENNTVFYFDLNKKELKQVTGNRLSANILQPPFKEQAFDCIICADVLEHLNDDKTALKNITCLLKHNGILLLTLPAFSALYSHHDKLIGHRRRYDKKDIKSLAKLFGFRIISIRYCCFIFFIPFLLNQFIFKKNPVYLGTSGIEKHILSLLKLIALVDSKIKLPFGLSLIAKLRKIRK